MANARLSSVGPHLGIAYHDLAAALAAGGDKALVADARRKSDALAPEHGFPDPFGPRERKP